MHAFEAVAAIDWSGARRADGIAIACCGLDRSAPRLVAPPDGRRWRRAQVRDWLLGRVSSGPRTLVGLDLAFSVPLRPGTGRLAIGPGPRGAANAAELWAWVEAVCAARADDAGSDLHAGAIPADPGAGGHFWRAGSKPPGFPVAERRAEQVARRDHGVYPESVFKLIGAKAVGLGSLSGMRLLHALKQGAPGRVAVWPFDDPPSGNLGPKARITCVEIFPRLFLARAGHRQRKLRDLAAVNGALARLGSAAMPEDAGIISDHDADALVAAAGMRAALLSDLPWSTRPEETRAYRQEGWVFTV